MSNLNIDKDFIIDLFNNKMREFYSYDIDEYIAVLYYYYTFPDTKIFLDFVEKVEDYVRVLNCNNTFLYRIIRLKAKFYKNII